MLIIDDDVELIDDEIEIRMIQLLQMRHDADDDDDEFVVRDMVDDEHDEID